MDESFEQMSRERLAAEYSLQKKRYEDFKGLGLKLNISRGVPAREQLELSQGLFDVLSDSEDYVDCGTDTRSYGLADGLPSAKALFAEVLGVSPKNVIIGGNSSLNMMYDMMIRSMCFGIGGCAPWSAQGKIKWICVVPGYDRHFAICEQMGMETVTVPMLSGGPDMDRVEELVKDPSVKGIWCVPKYSNPDGTTYSEETVRRFAALKPAAADFRIYWDNAYCIHDLYEDGDVLANIHELAGKEGNPNLVIEFMSTSKISFPGAGVACMAMGEEDAAYIKKLLSVQTIGPDKINQLRHVRFFRNLDGLKAQMKKHAAIIRPKFEAVLSTFEKEVSGLSFVKWTRPKGGYFISLWVMPGTAKRTVQLADEAGLKLTPAGSTWPGKNEPADSNIRIAPTNPCVEDISRAAELLCISMKLAALEKLLEM